MKILIDTCVWSLALRRGTEANLTREEQQIVAALAEAIRDGRVAILGPIRQEILSGIKESLQQESSQFEKLLCALEFFPDEPLTTADYEDAARLFNLCRSRGLQCGPIDILLCAVARRRQWSILTSDRALLRCLDIVNIHDRE